MSVMEASHPTESAGSARRNRGRPSLEHAAALDQSLLDIALGEFLADGYGGTSMAQIVRKAGISKTTLYSRYPSKEDLFRALLGRQVERFATLASLNAPDGTPNLRAGLERYAAKTLEIGLEPDMLAFNRLIHAEAQRFPELGVAAAERTRLGIAQVTWFITRCVETGQASCVDAEALAEAFILMMRGWYVNAMLANRPVPDEEREAWVARTVPALLAGAGTA